MNYSTEFGLAHAAYREFRPEYPEHLYDRIFAAGTLPRRVAVDLGAGTGPATAKLCAHFERVIAVEPDADMAAHIAETAPRAEVQNVVAERAQLDQASVDLVTCATAFHWMDGPAVVAAVARWLRPDGLFAVWSYPMPKLPAALDAVAQRELVQRWMPFFDPRLTERGQARRCIEDQAGLAFVSDEIVPFSVAMAPARMIGFLRSTSFVAAYLRTLSEPEAARYLSGLEREFIEVCEGPTVDVDLSLSLTLGRRD